MPFIGKGRWTWQRSSLEDKDLMDKIIERGHTLCADLWELKSKNTLHKTENPQTLWKKFKNDICLTATKHGKTSGSKISKCIDMIEKDLKALSNIPNLEDMEALKVNEVFLVNELAHLESIQARDRKDETRATLSNQGERLGGAWTAINKERKPRDLLYHLKIPGLNPPRFEQDTRGMVKLTMKYHSDLQQKDIDANISPQEYKERMEAALNAIPPTQRLSKAAREQLDWSLPQAQVLFALKSTKNGTTTGLDGCPYELQKALKERYKEDKENRKKKTFDIILTLATVFSDIESNRVNKRLDFAKGWMCPIYKKRTLQK